jgi:hypothetical protein
MKNRKESISQNDSNLGHRVSQPGSESNNKVDQNPEGPNSINAKGKLTEARDDIPHGQGAHVNEEESNASEDYPGMQQSSDAEPERNKI